ncbi:CaiB/BaiF CoA transferase family protein [Cupriavidus metallidurans]|uniref:Alpha-methylacyl-CoA racemase n=1 Tax=Cupriavidus metallidurans (strain ATCC 43123 / DSM 2839 / NBRC 102507 / CH34) TaxID=266264 RepID=Q1LBU2_CUPMC|nr:CaiB/BaiF CoA-transferase family protein [Cupriavidus metallidurans]ABF12384.1 Alpha-methylacyl-CoA racemase [Cupriavidus metallidurans CH34]QGS32386.1 CoA transferase [Cupriavidus metallidurans]
MGPLKGIKVVEMAGIAPGPFAAMMLADMGAEVLCIERPTAAQHCQPTASNVLHRNRRSLALDLKNPVALRVLRRLISSANALIEGYRPGVMERLGLGPEICLADNPSLVYGRMTGWGQDGPMAQAAGHDVNYISLTGALHAIGRRDAPPPIPLNLVGDFGGGGMFLAFGVVCALLEAQTSGLGQVVDAAMVDGAAAMMAYMCAARASGRWSDQRGENVLDGAAPWYRVYETSDGQYISVAAAEPKFYAELLRLLELSDETLPDQFDRSGWPTLTERLTTVFGTRSRAEWSKLLEGTDACFAPVLSLAEAPGHPHLRARNTFIEVDGIIQPAPAPRFSRTVPAQPLPWTPAKTDDRATLTAWGIDEYEISQLESAGILG